MRATLQLRIKLKQALIQMKKCVLRKRFVLSLAWASLRAPTRNYQAYREHPSPEVSSPDKSQGQDWLSCTPKVHYTFNIYTLFTR